MWNYGHECLSHRERYSDKYINKSVVSNAACLVAQPASVIGVQE